MNWEQQLEDLHLSQSLLNDQIKFAQDQIYFSSSEYIIQSTKDDIFTQQDLEESKFQDPETGLDVYYYASSDILDKKYLETYHYQAIYRGEELIGYERRGIDQQIVSASDSINLKTIRTV